MKILEWEAEKKSDHNERQNSSSKIPQNMQQGINWENVPTGSRTIKGVKGKNHKFPNLISEFLHRGKGIKKSS